MRQTSQPSGAEKKEAMKQAFKANSSRSSRGGQDTQSAKAEKAEKADVSSKKPTGTSTSSLRYRPFNFLLMCSCLYNLTGCSDADLYVLNSSCDLGFEFNVS